MNPDGKAMLKAAEYIRPHEDRSDEYPFQLITGRTIYHFHTRTKTARAPELNAAAPDVWVELCAADLERLGATEGALVDVVSPRSAVRGRVRVSEVRPGTVFIPFHYGYWDEDAAEPGDGVAPRAANEATITDWDPVSKQPIFKTAAARIELVEVAS
jgi:anaerobic selenocysteine-containing dehydrogenase